MPQRREPRVVEALLGGVDDLVRARRRRRAVRPVAPTRSPTAATACSHGSPLACSMSAAMPSNAIVEYRDIVPAAKSRPGASSDGRRPSGVSSGGSTMPEVWLTRCRSRTTSSRPAPNSGTAVEQWRLGRQPALLDEAQRGEPHDRLRHREQRVVVVDGCRPSALHAERVERDHAVGGRDAEHGGRQRTVVDVAADPVEGVVEASAWSPLGWCGSARVERRSGRGRVRCAARR